MVTIKSEAGYIIYQTQDLYVKIPYPEYANPSVWDDFYNGITDSVVIQDMYRLMDIKRKQKHVYFYAWDGDSSPITVRIPIEALAQLNLQFTYME